MKSKEWIKKDDVMDIIKGLPKDLWEEYIYMLKGVWCDEAPTVDAVEVVRCKDCKYSKHLKQYPKVNTWKCILTDVVYRADDFCSYGERREE